MSGVELALQNAVFHPRISQQDVADVEWMQRVAASLPPFVPRVGQYVEMRVIIDWDHRLPSRQIPVRVFGFFDKKKAKKFDSLVKTIEKRIAKADLFPEFDVPDFDGLDGDERYRCIFTPNGELLACVLTSPWKNTVAEAIGRKCAWIVSQSENYAEAMASIKADHPVIGSLSIASWIAPCEAHLPGWTVDIWLTLDFDEGGLFGRRYFVDPINEQIMSIEPFQAQLGY